MKKNVSGIKTTEKPDSRRLYIRKVLTRAGLPMSTKDIHAELAAKWGSRVNVRTTRRDLEDLVSVGYVKELAKRAGENHRSRYWMIGQESLNLAFSPEESLTLIAIFQHAERFGFWLGSAELEKLRDYAAGSIKSHSGNRLIAEGRITTGTRFTVLEPGQHNPEHLIEIQRALIEGRSLRIRYRPRDADGIQCTYVLRPLALAYQDSNIFLLARVKDEDWDGPAPDPSRPRGKYSSNGPGKTCALMLHRMVSVKETIEDVTEPPLFDVRAPDFQRDLMTVHDPELISLELMLNENLHNRLTENALVRDQKVIRCGSRWKLTCLTHDTQGLRLFLMSNASGIEVVQPAYLRQHIIAELDTAMAQYCS